MWLVVKVDDRGRIERICGRRCGRGRGPGRLFGTLLLGPLGPSCCCCWVAFRKADFGTPHSGGCALTEFAAFHQGCMALLFLTILVAAKIGTILLFNFFFNLYSSFLFVASFFDVVIVTGLLISATAHPSSCGWRGLLKLPLPLLLLFLALVPPPPPLYFVTSIVGGGNPMTPSLMGLSIAGLAFFQIVNALLFCWQTGFLPN